MASPQPKKIVTKPQEMQSELHAHGDPLLDAMRAYDQEVEKSAAHKEELKEVYDKHAKLVHEERGGGAVVGDHGWFYNDILPPK